MTTIFLSYSHKNKSLASKLNNDLSGFGVKIIIDEREVKYTDSLTSYMKKIRTSDYSILLISDDYLKSYYCMFEITELIKELDYNSKVLPVIIEDYCEGNILYKGARVYEKISSVDYLRYWENEYELLEAKIKSVKIDHVGRFIEELRITKEIAFNISSFIAFLRDKSNIYFNKLIEDNYSILLERIGLQNKLSDLRRARVFYGEAIFESDFNKKLLLFDKAIAALSNSNDYLRSNRLLILSSLKAA